MHLLKSYLQLRSAIIAKGIGQTLAIHLDAMLVERRRKNVYDSY